MRLSNPDRKDGFWLIHKVRQVIYVLSALDLRDQMEAVKQLIASEEKIAEFMR